MPTLTVDPRHPLRGAFGGSLVLALALLAGCQKTPEPPAPVVHQGPGLTAARAPQELLSDIRGAYRLAPDRRFVLALGNLEEISGTAPSKLEVTFSEEGLWEVTADGTAEPATLSEHPSFDELYEMVGERARSLAVPEPGAPEPGDEAPLETSPAVGPLGSLLALDAAWRGGERDPAVLQAAARHASRLLLELTDRMGVADDVPALAVAIVAAAEAASGRELWAERALVALETGYGRAAREAARHLKSDDPVRSYVFGDLEALAAASHQSTAGTFERVLYANTLYRLGHLDRLRAALGEMGDEAHSNLRLAALWAAAEREPGWDLTLAVNTVLAVERSLHSPVPALEKYFQVGNRWFVRAQVELRHFVEANWGQGDWLDFADLELGRLEHQTGGPLLPAEVHASFYRATLFSAARDYIGYFIYVLGSDESARVVQQLIQPRGSDTAGQFARYFDHLIDADSRDISPDTLVADIRDLTAFGPQALEDSYRALRDTGSYDPATWQAAKELARRCDSRLACREMLRIAAQRDLYDLPLAERLARGIVEEGGDVYWEAVLWLAFVDSDLATLERYATDSEQGELVRTKALFYLKQKAAPERVASLYDKALRETGGSSTVLDAYMMFLESKQLYRREVQVLERWLDGPHVPASPLSEELARVRVAKALRFLGDAEASWKILYPMSGSWFGATMNQAALTLLELGRIGDAEELAYRRLERYPYIASVTTLATIFWRTGRYDEAAQLLGNPPFRLTIKDWFEEIAPAFLTAFESRSAEDAELAFRPLVAARIQPWNLSYIPGAMQREGHLEHALVTYQAMKIPGLMGLWGKCKQYPVRKALYGPEEALSWLVAATPAAQRKHLGTFCHEVRTWEVAWEAIPDPEGDSRVDQYAWLMRAASWLVTGRSNPAWEQRLREHYEGRGQHFYDLLARHLLDLETVETVWGRVGSIDQVAEAAYFIALRAHFRGDLDSAFRWYRVAVESEQNQEMESRWSFAILYNLLDRGESVERLAARPPSETFL